MNNTIMASGAMTGMYADILWEGACEVWGALE